MASHSGQVDVACFEPGILHVPFVLQAKLSASANNDTTADQMKSRIALNLQVVLALHGAGIPIVPGSETGLQG